MTDNLACFIEILRRPSGDRQNLIDGVEGLLGDPGAEFGRAMRSLGIDILAAFKATPEGWVPAPDSPAFDARVAMGCAWFLNQTGAPDLSSAALAHVLLRNHSASIIGSHRAVRAFQVIPPLVVVQATVRAVVAMSRAAVLSWGLPGREPELPAAGPAEAERFLQTPAGSRLFARAAALTPPIGGERPLSSKSVLRAGLALGADQRIAHWVGSLSVDPVSFVRDDVGESPVGSLNGVPISAEAIATLGLAGALAEIAGQQVDADRLILASLLCPGSYLEALLRTAFGAGVNLPLLYVRSALPGALSQAEAKLLIEAGDWLASAGPFRGEVSSERFENLRIEALTIASAFSSPERLDAYATAAAELPAPLFPAADPVRRAMLTGGLRSFAQSELRSAGAEVLDGESLRSALRATADSGEGRAGILTDVFTDLCGDDPRRREAARRQLFLAHSDEVSTNLLRRIPPTTSEQCAEAVEECDASRLRSLVQADLLLAGGARAPRLARPARGVSVCVGGGPLDYAFGLTGADKGEAWRVRFAPGELAEEWSRVRERALGDNSQALREELLRHGARLGLDRIASELNGQEVDLLAVAPFDSLYLDLVIKAIARPASVAYRIFGGGPGSWQGSLSALARTAGQRLFVADPTASLRSARLEAAWLAGETGGELVRGKDADRARVLRSLEAAPDPAQLLHFTGHGTSGLIDSSGDLVSGVRVGQGDVLTAPMLSGSLAPRVLVASACDVACIPPTGTAHGWHAAAIGAGAGYSVAASIPVSDAGALAFNLLLYGAWEQVDDLESAMARASAIGRDPALLREWIAEEVENEEARDACLGWIARSEQADIERLFISFSLASP